MSIAKHAKQPSVAASISCSEIKKLIAKTENKKDQNKNENQNKN